MFLLLLVMAVAAVSCARVPAFRPSIIFVTWDSVRADHVSCEGYSRPTTPALDDICGEAVVFEQAYSSHNWTRTSYTSLLTSRHVWEFPALGSIGSTTDRPIRKSAGRCHTSISIPPM